MKTTRPFPWITPEEHDALKTSLLFLHMAELQELCERFSMQARGNKKELVASLLHFLKTGEQLQKATMPAASGAKRGETCELHPG